MHNRDRRSDATRSNLAYKMYKNNTRSRLFCRIPKRSISNKVKALKEALLNNHSELSVRFQSGLFKNLREHAFKQGIKQCSMELKYFKSLKMWVQNCIICFYELNDLKGTLGNLL